MESNKQYQKQKEKISNAFFDSSFFPRNVFYSSCFKHASGSLKLRQNIALFGATSLTLWKTGSSIWNFKAVSASLKISTEAVYQI
jgi:hypothetical protein